jgi:hypothetical protein
MSIVIDLKSGRRHIENSLHPNHPACSKGSAGSECRCTIDLHAVQSAELLMPKTRALVHAGIFFRQYAFRSSASFSRSVPYSEPRRSPGRGEEHQAVHRDRDFRHANI